MQAEHTQPCLPHPPLPHVHALGEEGDATGVINTSTNESVALVDILDSYERARQTALPVKTAPDRPHDLYLPVWFG